MAVWLRNHTATLQLTEIGLNNPVSAAERARPSPPSPGAASTPLHGRTDDKVPAIASANTAVHLRNGELARTTHIIARNGYGMVMSERLQYSYVQEQSFSSFILVGNRRRWTLQRQKARIETRELPARKSWVDTQLRADS